MVQIPNFGHRLNLKALLSFLPISSFVHIHWSLVGEACLAVLSVLDAGILYLMATTPNIWTAYVGYLLFRSLYQVSILNVRVCIV